MSSEPKPRVHGIFHKGTSTMTYVITDPISTATAILDSVLDYDAPSGRTTNEHNDKVVEYCQANSLDVRFILETHVHGMFWDPSFCLFLFNRPPIASYITNHDDVFVSAPSRPPHGGDVP